MDPYISLVDSIRTPVPLLREAPTGDKAEPLARQFAHLFVKEILKAAVKAGGSGPFAGGFAAEHYQELFLDAIAGKIAAADDLGLSRVFEK